VFYEGVQHRLRFCLDHLKCVKIAAFQLYRQSGKQSRVDGGQQSRWFGKKNSLVKNEVWDGLSAIMSQYYNSTFFPTQDICKFRMFFAINSCWSLKQN
jgi:hypothetical protein